MIRTKLILATTLMLLATAANAGNAAASACRALQDLKLEHGRVVVTHEVSAGKDYTFANLAMRVVAGIPLLDLPASCRVELELTPSADSKIRVQVWMPQDDWNQKFQGVGNGGFAGSIDKLSLSNALRQGYASASTDTGHEASDSDGSWALNHPEKALDYFSRAIHETAVAAKIVVTAYYGHAPKYSYFGSASNGGRQALIEAQRYPDDYDGILAGAPALSPTTELTGWGWTQQQLHKPGAYLSPDKLPAIAAAALAACDVQDGVKDDVIDDPRLCRFDPSTLRCHGKETDACLTAPQIEGLRAVYSGPGGSGPGGAYHGYFPGAELGKGGWQPWITGGKPKTAMQYVYVQEFVRNLVYNDASWSADHFDFKRDEAAIYQKLHAMDSADPDLSRFIARGGKLILYHGWNDPALSPQTTLDYYESVVAKFGKERAAGFVKLYMVPGLQHCIGGPGPNVFGQLAPGGSDPARSISAALEAWVEEGREPASIVATKYDSDFAPLIAPQVAKVLRTRPICPYPQRARWSGKGSTDDAANFSCVAADH